MIGVYKIPLHDAFLYSIVDPSMPHPDTLDREGDLVHAVYLNRDGSIEHVENFQNGICVSIKDYSYKDKSISLITETFPETGGENEIIYTRRDHGYKKEFRTLGELDFTEEYGTDDSGRVTWYCKRDLDGRVTDEYRLNDKGDIEYLKNQGGETTYEISYDQDGRPRTVIYHDEGGLISEKYYYSGDFLEKKELYYNDVLSGWQEFSMDADKKRITEKVFSENQLIFEIVTEDDKFHGHFFRIRTVHNTKVTDYRGRSRYGSDSGKYEIKYGNDGRIEEFLSSNDQYFDETLQIQFEPNAYYFLEPEE